MSCLIKAGYNLQALMSNNSTLTTNASKFELHCSLEVRVRNVVTIRVMVWFRVGFGFSDA